MRLKLGVLAALLLALGVGVLSSPAGHVSASSSTGADVLNINGCGGIGGGFTACVNVHAIENQTNTPSGNFSGVVNARADITVTDPSNNVVATLTASVHVHELVKNGTVQELGAHLTFNLTIDGLGSLCIAFDFHTANGQIQYANVSTVC